MVRRKLEQKSVWDPAQVLRAFQEHGVRPMHAKKLWSHLIRHPSAHWSDVPQLPPKAARLLDEQFCKFTTKVVECQRSEDGETTKLLLELQDGLQIESVIMHYDTTGRFTHEDGTCADDNEPPCSSGASCADSVATGATMGAGKGHKRATLCVSSQVGCQMACTFCATGTMGLKGNLTAGEIVEQLVHANAVSKVRNVVFMGMGEPLNNYDAVRAAIATMIDPRLFGLSPQRVTVSTVGVVNRVKQLGEDLPGIGLALSLHAPNQDLRIQIVPSAKAYHINKLIQSVAEYQQYSRQRIFVEYVLLAGVNDAEEHAHQLGTLLTGLKVLLNLIPWNPVLAAKEAHDYAAPSQESIHRFQAIVRQQYQVPTTVRQEKGQDISGACGQLALEKGNTAMQHKASTTGQADVSPQGFSATAQCTQVGVEGASDAGGVSPGVSGRVASMRALVGGVVAGAGRWLKSWVVRERGSASAQQDAASSGRGEAGDKGGEGDRAGACSSSSSSGVRNGATQACAGTGGAGGGAGRAQSSCGCSSASGQAHGSQAGAHSCCGRGGSSSVSTAGGHSPHSESAPVGGHSGRGESDHQSDHRISQIADKALNVSRSSSPWGVSGSSSGGAAENYSHEEGRQGVGVHREGGQGDDGKSKESVGAGEGVRDIEDFRL